MITLYRGDDTTFKGVKRLRVTIESKTSLAGCSATFEVCGVVKHVPDVSTGSFYLSLTGEDTAKMPLGTHVATLRVYDDESRRRTVTNTIMVCVTERIGDAYPARRRSPSRSARWWSGAEPSGQEGHDEVDHHFLLGRTRLGDHDRQRDERQGGSTRASSPRRPVRAGEDASR